MLFRILQIDIESAGKSSRKGAKIPERNLVFFELFAVSSEQSILFHYWCVALPIESTQVQRKKAVPCTYAC